MRATPSLVIPAQAGIHPPLSVLPAQAGIHLYCGWTLAFARVTEKKSRATPNLVIPAQAGIHLYS